MKKYKWIIILVNLVFILYFFNNSVVKKEAILSNGELIILELAPVDPRSLMQGDYMRLRYKIAEGTQTDSISKRGFCVLELASNRVGSKVRLQDGLLPLNENEYLIEYTTGIRDINIGSQSFFFQEGYAEKYENAKYGALKVDHKGNSILVGLYDENVVKIE